MPTQRTRTPGKRPAKTRTPAAASWLERAREDLRGLEAYAPEPSGPAVRLDANESPFDVPEELKREIITGFGRVAWNRYPDPAAIGLIRALAASENVPEDQILVGNGSDEIIRDLLLAFGGPGRAAVTVTPTFSMYAQLCRVTGTGLIEVPLGPNWEMDVPAVTRALRRAGAGLAFFASPNNPTGQAFPARALETLAQDTGKLIVVDEAYGLFGGESVKDRLNQVPNLAVLKTFSKSRSLAGLRVGYLLGPRGLVQVLNRVRLPYNLDCLAQQAAAAVLTRPEHWLAQAQAVVLERDRLAKRLAVLPGLKVFPSQANFLLLQHPQADQLRSVLAVAGVAVRGFAGHPRLQDCLRVTVGTPRENDQFLQALARALAAKE